MLGKKFLNNIKEFFNSGIWDTNIDEMGNFKARVVKHLKVFVMTLRFFSNQKVGYHAVSLAFFSSIAAIPCLAVAFAITKGFGIGDELESLLLLNFSDKEDVIRHALEYANNVIAVTNQGKFGIISFLCFAWLVFWLMIQVEKTFNHVWRVCKSRKIIKRLTTYMAIVFLLPFVVFMFLSTTLQFTNSHGLLGNIFDIPVWKEVSKGLSWLLVYICISFVLTLMYKFIPNAKVILSKALQAALITALMFCLFQWIYVETQVFFNRLNGVFGAVAAIPFMMIWLNVAWFIVLFGSELSYAFQHVDNYKLEE